MPDIVNLLKNFHPIRSLLRQRGQRQFLSKWGVGYHYGSFGSFAEARAWLPKTKEFSFPDFANEYIDERSHRVYPFDYPVLFWLRQAFEEGSNSVLDIGGSIGNQFYAYGKYLKYPANITWQVHELPAFIKVGQDLALQRNAPQLSFSDKLNPEQLAADIWIAAGAVEFIEGLALDQLLIQARQRPRHVFLSKLPLYDGPTHVSTQNIGNGSFVPHHVFNRQQYIAAIEKAGYRLVDSWGVPDRRFQVPGQPENSFDEYSGLYFTAI